MDEIIARLAESIRAAGAVRQPLRIRGGGTKDFYGQALHGDVLDTRAYAGIIDYDPTELVLTARCGTSLTEIEATMKAQGQMLGFEPGVLAAPVKHSDQLHVVERFKLDPKGWTLTRANSPLQTISDQ